VVAGILIAYFSNYLLAGVGGENDWRWMLGVVAIPHFIFLIVNVDYTRNPKMVGTIQKR
jgi:SP family arabinose:H+ symporter-like MFS transporter